MSVDHCVLLSSLVVLGLSVGCKDPDTAVDDFIQDITIEMSAEISSVVTASWTTREPSLCSVDFGVSGETIGHCCVGHEPSLEHRAVMVGIQPGSDGSLVITAEAEDASYQSDEQFFTTGLLAAQLPSLEVEGDENDRLWEGYTLVPLLGDEVSWVTVIDAEGVIVWAYEAGPSVHRIHIAPDGSGLFYNEHSQNPDADFPDLSESLHHVSWEGEKLLTVRGGESPHHDFLVLDNDRFVTLGNSLLPWDFGEGEVLLQGDTIMEIDREGKHSILWNTFDHMDPDVATSTENQVGPHTGEVLDWSHGNYLSYDEDEGAYLAVLRHLDAVVSVDAGSGELLWSLAEGWGDYQSGDGEPLLSWPHSVERTDEGLVVFNQTHGGSDECSHSVTIGLDDASGVAERIGEYATDDCRQVEYLGSTHPVPNGNSLVVFSQAGIMDELSPEGELLRRLQTELGWMYGYVTHSLELLPEKD